MLYTTFFFLQFSLGQLLAQRAQADTLFTTILELDNRLFDAFNKRDTVQFGALFSKDLEFYHDKGGLTGYAATMDFLKMNKANNSDLKRRLVPGSSAVYPIPGYGAIQTGQHEFCHTENNQPDCGTFKFVHIWKQEGNTWRITRVISFDH